MAKVEVLVSNEGVGSLADLTGSGCATPAGGLQTCWEGRSNTIVFGSSPATRRHLGFRVLRESYQLGSLRAQDFGDPVEGPQRRALQPALQLAHIGPVQLGLEPELLLTQPLFLP